MIIDVHNHIVAGNELQNFQAGLINSAGFHRPAGTVVTEESIQGQVARPQTFRSLG